MSFTSEIDNLRLIYKEIIDGFSVVGNGDFLIKHLNDLENIEVLQNKTLTFEKYVKEGIPSQDDKIKSLIANGEWTEAREEEILTLKYNISDNEKNVQDIIPEQRPPVLEIIKTIKVKLRDALAERNSILGTTADYFAERESFNFMVYLSLYKNKQERVFNSYDAFCDLEDEEIVTYGEGLEKTIKKFSQKTLNHIAVMPFFLNSLSYVKDNLHNFLQKPIAEMTNYQAALFSLGMRNLNILANSEKDPPELFGDVKIDDLVLFYDMEYSVLLGRRNVKAVKN